MPKAFETAGAWTPLPEPLPPFEPDQLFTALASDLDEWERGLRRAEGEAHALQAWALQFLRTPSRWETERPAMRQLHAIGAMTGEGQIERRAGRYQRLDPGVLAWWIAQLGWESAVEVVARFHGIDYNRVRLDGQLECWLVINGQQPPVTFARYLRPALRDADLAARARAVVERLRPELSLETRVEFDALLDDAAGALADAREVLAREPSASVPWVPLLPVVRDAALARALIEKHAARGLFGGPDLHAMMQRLAPDECEARLALLVETGLARRWPATTLRPLVAALCCIRGETAARTLANARAVRSLARMVDRYFEPRPAR